MLFPKFVRGSQLALFLSVLLVSITVARSAEPGRPSREGSKVHGPSDEGELAIKKFKVPDDFKVELFAAEPMLANPVCFGFDEKGNVYVVETFRHSDGVVDNRHHMNWLEEDLASQSLEDQLAKIEKYRPELPNMTRESERISLIRDTNGDGKADTYSIFAEGFTNVLDGIAAGVLARKGDVYFTCIPDLYLLRDTNGDGKADVKQSLQTGYGIRYAFIGHDLHGLRIGPDGRLYFSIGDRGFNVKQGDRTIAFTEGGAVLRCDLDGSNLEIFAYGLRNPQELAFDDYGNLFTGDNNSDGGDQARWCYVVEGGDSGWRVGWQYITSPNNRGPWNSEKMWDPEGARSVGYIVPPLANLGNGPSGLTYYPGVGLPQKYNGHFFLCDFKGSGAKSLVHTFTNKPKGAGFELADREDFVSSMLVTDVEFGPDCAVYVSDWTEGWEKPGKGRLYRVSPTNPVDGALAAETKKLIAAGMDRRGTKELVQLLHHRDQRVRQEAQFALADKKQTKPLLQVIEKSTNQLARIHAIWGLGQIAHATKSDTLKQLVALLEDPDAEIRAQAAKALGEARFAPATAPLIKALQDVSRPRVQYFAAIALGKIGDKKAVRPVIEMLRANSEQDPFLRHAGIMALTHISDTDAILEAMKDDSAAVRLAVAVSLRRLHRAEIATMLHDRQQSVVLEAARAINDLPIIQALPELAKLIERPNYDEALFRRVLNANFRVGEAENAKALADFAAREDAPEPLRVEAMQMLTDWQKPSGLDRVTGLWRPLSARPAEHATTALQPHISKLLAGKSADVTLAALAFAERYKLMGTEELLFQLLSNSETAVPVRVEALRLMGATKHPRLSEAIDLASKDSHEKIRKQAISLQAKLSPGDASAPLLAVLENGTTGEKQTAFASLAAQEGNAAESVLGEWVDKLLEGKVPAELQLDVIDAAKKRNSANLKAKLEKYEASKSQDPSEKFKECLVGGNAEEGKKIFFERVEASCVRCHKVNGEGAEVGPILDGYGTKKTRDYILKAIVDPNAEIAAGFESVIVTLKNGSAYAGTLKSEDDKELVINSPEDGIITVKKDEIEQRERGMSGMPPELANVLSKQDIRNLVEFIATLK